MRINPRRGIKCGPSAKAQKSRKMKDKTTKAKVMADTKTGTYQELVLPSEGSLIWVSNDNPVQMFRLARCWNILRTMTEAQLESLEKQVDATIEEVGEDFVGVHIGPSLPF